MNFDRLVKNLSGIMAAVLLFQSVTVSYAASPDASSREMLREIYTRLNEVNQASGNTPEISVEAELEYFEKNVRDVESAQEFIRSLFSLIHPDPNFDHRAKLHPFLEELRKVVPSVMNVKGLIPKAITNSGGEPDTLYSDLVYYATGLAISVFLVGASSTQVAVYSQCMSLCSDAVSQIPGAELLTRGGEFPGGNYICQSYWGDRDQSRYSGNPRFNYNAIDQQIGNPSCRDFQMDGYAEMAGLGIACAALPITIYTGQRVYGGVCQTVKFLKKYWKSWNNSGAESSEAAALGRVLGRVEAELGIRHIDQISFKLVGIRVLVSPCANEFDICPICRVNFTGFEGTVATECCHNKFDQDCLQQWFESLETRGEPKACPLCRSRL